MENITNQISYLKGLIDGLELDETSKEAKIFNGIIDVLDEISDTLEDMADFEDEIAEQVDAIDEDLAAVEDIFLDGDCDGDCEGCYEDCEFNDDDEAFYEVECPNCGDIVCFDEDLFEDDDTIICPNCGEKIDIDFDLDEDVEDEE